MKKIEFTWETKADVMGDTRADVRAEVSFWKVEKYLVLSDILFGFIFECSKDGCGADLQAVKDMQNWPALTWRGRDKWRQRFLCKCRSVTWASLSIRM